MTDEDGGHIKGVAGLTGGEETRKFYKGWAEGYEAEMRASGYHGPARCAAALAKAGADRSQPLLDLGCGTGLAGEAFRAEGFAVIDGADFSAEMMAVAAAKPGLYRALKPADLTDPIPAEPGEYASIAAVGSLGPGHAPPEIIDRVIALLRPGGFFVFSLNDHALADPAYEGRVREVTDTGAAEVAFREYGPHVNALDIGSVVYVLRKR